MSHVSRVDVPVTLLLLTVLGLVGLAPLVARLIADHGPSRGLPVYLLLVGSILFVTSMLGIYAQTRGLLHSGIDQRSWVRRMAGAMLGALILGAVAAWHLAQRQPVNSTTIVTVAAILAITGRFMRAGSVQRSSVSRP